MKDDLASRQYPIGKFLAPASITDDLFRQWVVSIANFPEVLAKEVEQLTVDELQQTYREGGWTIEQLVHHCADSHMNSFIRFKLAITEEEPTIKPYLEAKWALLPDVLSGDVTHSLLILRGLHARWAALLASLADENNDRYFVHPETQQRVSLRMNTGIYAWHGEHHLAHIRLAKAK